MSKVDQFQHLRIQLEAIQSATNNFSDENCIGHGGFGNVFKGELVHSKGETVVALKRLDRKFGQGNPEFWKEVMMLSFYRHENIVSLLGYCDDHGEKILVYEYLPKKSLDFYLADIHLTWVHRLKICIGVARGLGYLHTPAESQLRIFHRDIKSSNILLDNNWNAKISDFGLAKFAPANSKFTFLVSNPTGTLGYIDPLYHETGLLTKESDVYSFGVVLFEVLCGRLCFGNKDIQPLVGLVREYYEQNKISELVYSKIKNEISISSLKSFVDIAYQCLRRDSKERPSMIEIVRALESALDLQECQGARILNVKVVRSKTSFNAFNHQLVFYIDGQGPLQIVKTTAKYNEENAERNEEFTLSVENFRVRHLYILVNELISVEKHRQLGKTRIKLRDLTPKIPLTCQLDVRDDNNHSNGYLTLELLYTTNFEDVIGSVQKAPIGTPKDGGVLIIIIRSGYLHVNKNHAGSYVSMLFRGELRKTQSILNTKFPMWLQEYRFMLEQPPTNEKLQFEVINDYSSWGREKSLGCVDVSLADVVDKKETKTSYKLEPGYLVQDPYEYSFLEVELHWKPLISR